MVTFSRYLLIFRFIYMKQCSSQSLYLIRHEFHTCRQCILNIVIHLSPSFSQTYDWHPLPNFTLCFSLCLCLCFLTHCIQLFCPHMHGWRAIHWSMENPPETTHPKKTDSFFFLGKHQLSMTLQLGWDILSLSVYAEVLIDLTLWRQPWLLWTHEYLGYVRFWWYCFTSVLSDLWL